MKHSGILAAAACILVVLNAPVAAAANRYLAVACDNDGRCVQHIAAAEPRTAKQQHRAPAKVRLRGTIDANGNRSAPITVPTAAGIDITVAPGFAAPAAAVIADLVATGFTPKKLTCQSFAKSHVAGSLHFRARACDVAQCGWGCTPAPKQKLRMIVARHGLRDGCEFGDAGHFDNGPHLAYARVLRNCGHAYAEAIEPSLKRQAAAGINPPNEREPWPRLVKLAPHP